MHLAQSLTNYYGYTVLYPRSYQSATLCVQSVWVIICLYYVSTKEWSTPLLQIKCGVFQGDTLSPLLFLLAFNPLLHSIISHPSRGYSLSIPHERSNQGIALPSEGSYIYAL